MNKRIKLYDVNENYLALRSLNIKEIEIYDIQKARKEATISNKSHCKIKIENDLLDFRFNQKYKTIIIVGLIDIIELFDISIISNKQIIEEPKFIFNLKEDDIPINSLLFNPFNSHIITYSCNKKIKIWSIRKPSIFEIKCSGLIFKMKWQKDGDLLGFFDKQIKIYDRKQKKIIFILEGEYNFELVDFEFLDNQNIIVCGLETNKIL